MHVFYPPVTQCLPYKLGRNTSFLCFNSLSFTNETKYYTKMEAIKLYNLSGTRLTFGFELKIFSMLHTTLEMYNKLKRKCSDSFEM